MKNKLIISLTTIPSRIDNIEPILDSLINQKIKPDMIYINVPKKYKRFKETIKVPDFIKEKFSKQVKIYYLDKDYGPATKFIGSLLNKEIKKDDILVITDDDVVKTKNWLKILLDNHKNNRITSFVERELGEEIIWGYLGYIFQRKIINLDDVIHFFNKIKSECYYIDDHWFTGYCHYRKIKIYNIPIDIDEINFNFEHGDSIDSLVMMEGNNNRGLLSFKCRNIIKEEFNTEFPFWCCLGCCENQKEINFSNQSTFSKYKIFIQLVCFFIIKLIICTCLSKYNLLSTKHYWKVIKILILYYLLNITIILYYKI